MIKLSSYFKYLLHWRSLDPSSKFENLWISRIGSYYAKIDKTLQHRVSRSSEDTFATIIISSIFRLSPFIIIPLHYLSSLSRRFARRSSSHHLVLYIVTYRGWEIGWELSSSCVRLAWLNNDREKDRTFRLKESCHAKFAFLIPLSRPSSLTFPFSTFLSSYLTLFK